MCELLGNKMGNAHTHSVDFCFANPLYKRHIAAVMKKRMGELKTLSGKEEVPEWAKTMLTEWTKMDKSAVAAAPAEAPSQPSTEEVK